MLKSGIINAFQKTLPSFEFEPAQTFSEQFAQNRFNKKMEVPSSDSVNRLSAECWSNWLETDEGLPNIHLPPGEWYRARMFLHRNMLPVRLDKFEFPKGTEFIPTRGENSIEARLCHSRWTCTVDNFSLMAGVCYGHKALKRAVRRRYANWFTRQNFDFTLRQADAFLYRKFSNSSKRPAFDIFSWKLSRVVSITQGSRFSTVPKNNKSRRPINIEPFGNILTQRAIGLFLRDEVKRLFDVDLDTLAQVHRIRIRDVDGIATIDLKNASDSVSLKLCEFLLPQNLYAAILKTRSSMVLGPDGSYHLTKKVSSMGNGFTFELMTLILTALCRTLDQNATVFGDDIVIERRKSSRLIELLEAVGFQVNIEKSFTEGPFRESCGANYHNVEGYVESYDFTYPENIGDCVVSWNKVVRLAPIYPSFKRLHSALLRSIPQTLRGGPNFEFENCEVLELVGRGLKGEDPDVDFPLYFVTPKCGGSAVSTAVCEKLSNLSYNSEEFRLVEGYSFCSDERSPSRKHLEERRHWAKYEMYLHAGRRTKDVLSNQGKWVSVWFVTSGERTFRASALMT